MNSTLPKADARPPIFPPLHGKASDDFFGKAGLLIAAAFDHDAAKRRLEAEQVAPQ
jgi:hypothetical protein